MCKHTEKHANREARHSCHICGGPHATFQCPRVRCNGEQRACQEHLQSHDVQLWVTSHQMFSHRSGPCRISPVGCHLRPPSLKSSCTTRHAQSTEYVEPESSALRPWAVQPSGLLYQAHMGHAKPPTSSGMPSKSVGLLTAIVPASWTACLRSIRSMLGHATTSRGPFHVTHGPSGANDSDGTTCVDPWMASWDAEKKWIAEGRQAEQSFQEASLQASRHENECLCALGSPLHSTLHAHWGTHLFVLWAPTIDLDSVRCWRYFSSFFHKDSKGGVLGHGSPTRPNIGRRACGKHCGSPLAYLAQESWWQHSRDWLAPPDTLPTPACEADSSLKRLASKCLERCCLRCVSIFGLVVDDLSEALSSEARLENAWARSNDLSWLNAFCLIFRWS